jgi:hypothetical protein
VHGHPQPADDDHVLLLLLAVTHGLARFVDRPEDRPAVDLVAREWDRPRPPTNDIETASSSVDATRR